MNKQLKTALQLIVGIGIAAALLYLTFRDSSLEELAGLKETNFFWVGMGGFAMFGMYIFRALRWGLMLDRAGHPAKFFHLLLATLITYLVNSLTPKLGEILRCTVLLKTDKVPVATSLGTVVSERVADVLVLLLGVSTIFLMELDRLGNLFGMMWEKVVGGIDPATLGLVGVIGLVLMGLGIYFLRSKRFSGGLIGKAQTFVKSMLEAAKSVLSLEKPWLFAFHTLMLWVCLVFAYYFFMLGLPETEHLGLYMAILLLFIGGIGWALPVPGGMGTTHFIIWQLFLAFNLPEAAGKNIGILSNGATLAYNVIFGMIAWLIFLGLSYRMDQAEKNVALPEN
ncbi:MAG: lysylphosphatidylglycerol synthase transmembrane domain-containing protein [Bacteroidota bacterium]